ncbi:hypothetical protein DQ384_33010 [Sphaerisporangium album]|uniref:Uncharacterized protein n=1 Tax=Sphaerisporangium album TaxID=509200 RepID=A0A367F3F6_9ACTN|nr:hypothetical protein [Sphaerisporangium album]RCG24469.1 hypothetical protein DQ384_33010 [Sphaerisporangium album]
MDAFERGLGRAEDTLGRNEPRIRRTLQQLDLDTSGLDVLREMRTWIATSRPDLRRRSQTIRAEHSDWSASSSLPGGLTAFDEALYAKAAHHPDVYAAALKLGQAAENGKVDANTLAELEKRAKDPGFATTLMNAMGAKAYTKLMGKIVAHKNDVGMNRLLVALGQTLGTASPKLSTAWRNELNELLSGIRTNWSRMNWQEGYGLALALKHGTFPTEFLTSVAKKLDAWDRKAHANPIGLEQPMMITVLEALSKDPAAAQDFFLSDPNMLKRFMTERRLSDNGDALGKAIEAATLYFRDHDGTPQKPSRGFLSAKLASEFIKLEIDRVMADDSFESHVPPLTTGRVLAGYIIDINGAAQSGTTIPSVVSGADNPLSPGQDPWGVGQFDRVSLNEVMKQAFTDEKAFAIVLAAQTVLAARLLDHGAAEVAAGRGDDALVASVKQAAAGFGLIRDAAGLAGIESGKEMDEAKARNMKILAALVDMGLAWPQEVPWARLAGGIGAWTGMIEDMNKGNAEDKARLQADQALDLTRNFVHDLAAQAMLKHGLFGKSEPPARTHPWATLEGLNKGDDPRDNPNNFLKDDGRTLMTRDEMIDKKAANETDMYRRVEAYERWLREGLSGRSWRDLENQLDVSFFGGLRHHGS